MMISARYLAFRSQTSVSRFYGMHEIEEKRGPGLPRKTDNITDNNIIIFSELNNYEKIKYLISKINNYLFNFRGKYLIIFLIIIIIIIFPIGIFIGRRTFIIDDYTFPQYSYITKFSHLHKS